uniref:Uncharacterized protein n=1 Tax=Panagrolaimus sp. JU765 TaxID=591449 RepID=A0AC34QSN7_9BILA
MASTRVILIVALLAIIAGVFIEEVAGQYYYGYPNYYGYGYGYNYYYPYSYGYGYYGKRDIGSNPIQHQ